MKTLRSIGLAVLGCLMLGAGQADAATGEAVFAENSDGSDWAAYGRTYGETHFSPLDEVNAANIQRLGLAWFKSLPDGFTGGAPLAVGGVLYYPTGLGGLHAVNAADGRVLWDYDADVPATATPNMRAAWGMRGIAYWDGKVYLGTLDGRLIAVDAKTGKQVWSAQTTTPGDGLYITGAPRVFKGKVIIGNGGADFGAVRGYVTAYDAGSGKQLWRFYAVPSGTAEDAKDPAQAMAAKTWTGERWKAGGGGTPWNALTYDPELNRIYVGTGNGSPWNALVRSPGGGDNLFLCSIVALDADTGKYIWHYQVNPDETWDYTATMDITLATLPIDGKPRRVLMQAPKNGFFYVIDRDTGKLISANPIAKVTWAQRIDLTTGRPVENPEARPKPDSVTEIWPGPTGAHNWQPMAYSPKTNLVYIPVTELPGVFDTRGMPPEKWTRASGIDINTGYKQNDLSVPLPPPDAQFGKLVAISPITGKNAWTIPLRAPINGGVLATGGGLVFQGTAEGRFIARDAGTGRQVWAMDAQNGIVSQPITYRVGGRQYITVMTGVGGTASIMGGISSQFGWSYRTQPRRMLTFVLDGKASLPAQVSPAAEVLPKSTFVVNSDKARRGEQLYGHTCFLCHGAGVVSGGGAPDLRYSQVPLSDEAFQQVVREGLLVGNGMPRFGEMSPEDVTAIQHYIRRRADETAKESVGH